MGTSNKACHEVGAKQSTSWEHRTKLAVKSKQSKVLLGNMEKRVPLYPHLEAILANVASFEY